MKCSPNQSASAREALSNATLPMPNWPTEVRTFEPVYGLLHRAANQNYAFSLSGFLDSLGLNGRSWDYKEFLEIARQLPLGGQDDLEWNSPRQVGDAVEICGHTLPRRYFSKKVRRVCPKCIDESRHIRIWFDLVPIANCPIHDVELITGLANDPIDWCNPEIGWTLNGVRIDGRHAAAKGATELDKFVFAALGGDKGDSPDHLKNQPLQAVIAAAICVGRLFQDTNEEWSGVRTIRELAQIGFPPLIGGAEAIIDFLSSANWLVREFDQSKYTSRCNQAPKLIRTIPSDSLQELVLRSFRSVRLRTKRSSPTGRLASFDGQDGFWGLKGAARLLAVRPEQLKDMLHKLSIKPKRCGRAGIFRISADHIYAVQDYISSSLSSREAADVLGCEKSDIDELVQRKLLQVEFRLQAQRYFSRAELASCVDRAVKHLKQDETAKSKELNSYASERGLSLATAYSMIVREQGMQLTSYEKSAPFFHGAKVVSRCSSKRRIRKKVRPAAQVRGATSFASAAARLGTKPEGLKQLVEMSFLKIEDDYFGQPRISTKSLEEFDRKYVRASMYAPLLKCPARTALRILRKSGIEPINDSEHSFVRFVARDEVQRLTGLNLNASSFHHRMVAICDALSDSMSSQAIPATVRIVAKPALVVRATTGRWSFEVNETVGRRRYQLTCGFRSQTEPARLRKIRSASIEPKSIWPTAEIQPHAKGGFVLIDEFETPKARKSEIDELARRCTSRAYQLHQIL